METLNFRFLSLSLPLRMCVGKTKQNQISSKAAAAVVAAADKQTEEAF